MSDKSVVEFAKALHDAYVKSGPHPAKAWDELDEHDRTFVVAIYDQVFKDLVTLAIGNVAEGKPAQLVLTANEGNVRLDFGQPMAWIGFSRADAIEFAIAVLQKCGVPVNITFNPPPTPQEGKTDGRTETDR